MKLRFIYRAPGTEGGGDSSTGSFGAILGGLNGDSPEVTADDLNKDELENPEEGEEPEEEEKPETPKKLPKVEKKDPVPPVKKEEEKVEEEEGTEEDVEEENPEEEDEDEDTAGAEAYFEELKNLYGYELPEVDYGQTDPLSPEGELLRHEAVRKQNIEDMETYFRDKYPKGYAALLHDMSGKPMEEFFGQNKDLEALPTEDELEASTEKQKAIILKDLIAKGTDEKYANVIIKSAVENDELEDLAKRSLKSRADAQKQHLDNIERENTAKTESYNKVVSDMNTFVTEFVSTGKIGNVTIPKVDQEKFADDFKKRVQFDGKKFLLVTELTNDNIADVFQKEYFGFKGGNLDKIIKAKAQTVGVNRLRTTAPKKTVKSSSAPTPSGNKTIAEVMAEQEKQGQV